MQPTTETNEDTKRFAIQRDFSDGLLTKWEEVFPPGLEEYGVTEEQFRFTIQNLNRLFYETEQYTCLSCFEASIACISFYTYYLCFPGQYNRGKRKIELFIQEQNNTVYSPNVTWLNPFRNGLLNIIIVAG